MDLKEIYNNYYDGNLRDDEVTRMVIEYVENEDNVKLLEKYNKDGIQPALAFIYLNAIEMEKYKYLFKSREFKQYYGTLFGAIFYEKDYNIKLNKRLKVKPYIKNATLFKK